LTNKEAEQKVVRDGKEESLLSAGTVEGLDDLIAKIGLSGCKRKELTVSSAETVARYIEMLSFLLLIGGVLGLYIEFKTPGFGLPGILGITLLAVWFWGHHVAGLAGMGEVLLFLLGVVFVVVEVFWFPGFGIIGAAGVVMVVVSLIMAMVQHYPGGSLMPPLKDIGRAVQVLGVALGGAAVAGFILARYLPKTAVWNHLVLATEETKASGFAVSVGADPLLGKSGVALTDLRPGGIAMIGDRRMDVVTRGIFVDKGASILVAEVRGARVVVEPDGSGSSSESASKS
jgi:membrane-bound serine protease (ClpP class)